MPSFRHIDWCQSTGPFGAKDCDCPYTEREEYLLQKYGNLKTALFEVLSTVTPKYDIDHPEDHGFSSATGDIIRTLFWENVEIIEYFDEADDMCPNCLTPWKCNGPHLSDQTIAARRNKA